MLTNASLENGCQGLREGSPNRRIASYPFQTHMVVESKETMQCRCTGAAKSHEECGPSDSQSQEGQATDRCQRLEVPGELEV